ncbi:MAG: SPOR domain-containing protein [Magnetococcales bacterium]|nr:SPOR domain-containing protein [Magnetococcales bacterium]MBF0262312.1 SPOR domain-containing protein [Magnetococcales bacterium]
MTGAPIESESPRQEIPQANADIIINPTEGQRRAAAIQRRKRIGKHLSEALIAAVVGGVVTLMVWNHAAPPGNQSAESLRSLVTASSEQKIDAKSDGAAVTRTETVIPAGAAGMAAAPAAPAAKGDAEAALRKDLAEALSHAASQAPIAKGTEGLAAAKIEPIPAPIAPLGAALDGKKSEAEIALAARSAPSSEEMAEDAIGAAMEGPADDSLDDGLSVEKAKSALKGEALKAPVTEVPVIKAKSEAVKAAEAPAMAKAQPLPRMPEPKPLAHATEAKAEAKAIPAPLLAPKSEAKAAPLAQEAKVNFPQSQADGSFLVTAGSYSNVQGAERIQKKLSDAGIPVRLRKSQLNNHTVHHLLTGPFATVEMAGQAVATIKERTGIEARYVTVAESQASKGIKKSVTSAKLATDNAAKSAAARTPVAKAPAKAPAKETTVAKAQPQAPAKATPVTVAKAPAKAVKETTVAKAAVATPIKAKESTVAKAPASVPVKEAPVAKATVPAAAPAITIAKVATPAIAPAKEAPVAKAPVPAIAPVKEVTAAKEITIPRTGEFVAHAGSFSNPENANQLRRRLIERGISSYTKVSTINGKEYTHVILGPFPNQHDADVKMSTLHKETGIVAKAMSIH